MESITGATGDGDPATLPGDPITGAQTGDFMGVPATTMGDPIASELGDPSEPTEDPDVTSRDTAAPAKGGPTRKRTVFKALVAHYTTSCPGSRSFRDS
ncbi:unnamed protein product [Brassica napus]|uniref:(rape) hypothetical protein n=1 Tax=Brassica napus TaxID=3708 RepID=A0A816L973_BRANA|nr:unnamed protein product [Brassica napus]